MTFFLCTTVFVAASWVAMLLLVALRTASLSILRFLKLLQLPMVAVALNRWECHPMHSKSTWCQLRNKYFSYNMSEKLGWKLCSVKPTLHTMQCIPHPILSWWRKVIYYEWNISLTSDRTPVATHLPLAFTRSSSEEENKLMNTLEQLSTQFKPRLTSGL